MAITLLSPELKAHVNEQLALVHEDFCANVCPVADGQVNEMFGDGQVTVLSLVITGDDGKLYDRYVKVALNGGYELITEADFQACLLSLEDMNDYVSDL